MATAGLTGKNQTTADAANENVLANITDFERYDLTTMAVRVRSTSAANAIVRLPELHGDTGGACLIPGQLEYFRVAHGGITSMYLSGDGGIATVDWYAVAKTNQS